MKKKPRKSPRHPFRFKVDDGEKVRTITEWAKVKRATKPVKLVLTAADVRRSINLKGVGNTQTCAMAVCAKRQAQAFPHPVEGYIDWQYKTAFVVTKVRNGLPVECVVYQHDDEIAKLNDSPDGQRRLLAKLEKDGDRLIHLRPSPPQKPKTKRAPTGRKTGERSSRPAAVGAKLRFAVAELGGAFPSPTS